jgi:hypothetical protein
MSKPRPSPLDDGDPLWLDRLRQAERADPSPKPMGFAKIVRAWRKAYSKPKEPRS